MANCLRFISAAVVAIALIAAQIAPSWAGCHSQRHAAGNANIVKVDALSHHSTPQAMPVMFEMQLVSADQPQPSTNDICLGNCGCACGISGAFVLASVTAIDAPHGAALTRDWTSSNLPRGDRPDGPRRPPRPIA